MDPVWVQKREALFAGFEDLKRAISFRCSGIRAWLSGCLLRCFFEAWRTDPKSPEAGTQTVERSVAAHKREPLLNGLGRKQTIKWIFVSRFQKGSLSSMRSRDRYKFKLLVDTFPNDVIHGLPGIDRLAT